MKLHLPVRLFKSVLACLTAVASFSLGSGVAWAEAQNLTFSGSSLTWDTSAENKPFVDEEDAAASFAAGDNVSFTGESTVTLGENITAGTLDIAAGADVTIGLGNYTLNADTISLSGTLDVGDSLSIASGSTLAVKNAAAVLDSALVLGEKSGLVVESSASLNNNSLTLQGGSNLILTAAGDGKTYTLFSGISSLVDKNGDTLAAGSYSVNDYFDTTQPGTGFWKDATLVLNDGTLQLVRHNETVKDAVTITTRRTSGADYQYYAGVSFKNIEYAAVDSNAYGGAIYGGDDSTITLSGNGSVTFSGNTASSSSSLAYGGAIYTFGSVTMSDNGSVTFSGNTASSSGGAIYTYGSVTMSGNGIVTFSGNSASYYGGAIYGSVTMTDNGSVTFTGNTASDDGGAIYGSVTMTDNGSVTFSGNSATNRGGAIDGSVTMTGNGSVTFSGNSATNGGGAIYGGGDITLSSNSSVEFSGNSASYDGGAILGSSSSTITLSDNGSVTFTGNTASDDGGAIYGSVTMTDNGSVTFSGNTASSKGGAIAGSVTMSGNGSVTFSGNTASSSGGAIYGSVTMTDNGSVTFSGNSAFRDGAIFADGNLSICNNDSVLFEKNAEVRDGTYRLRSVYVGGFGDVISLSAAAGKSIEFRDSVYIASDSTLNLNADYTDAVGVGHKQMGDIIFTGKYAETHLNELLAATEAGRTATAEEILNSRTTVVGAMTNLYGGRLRVEDGAIYKGYGITAHEDSAATVRVQNATLNQGGYDLTFNSGTTLELTGNNTISGDVRMLENSTLLLNVGDTVGCTGIIGNLDIAGGMTLSDSGSSSIENGILMYVSGGLKVGTENSLTGSAGDCSVTWVGNLLVLNYNEATFNLYFNGTASYNTRQVDKALWHHYQALTFEKCGNDAVGGAIYGYSSSTISLSNNGSVTFSGNSASSYGGAIYGGGDITLSSNSSVEFSGNSASLGGAIYGSVTMTDNGSVTFSGNSASSGGAIDGSVTMIGNESVTFSGNTASNNGGAIYGGSDSTITLSNNGSVTFSGNTASSYGGAIYTKGSLCIQNNDSVLFEKNVDKNHSGYRLHSIYAYGGSDDVISLSAAADNSIEFRDSVYIDSGSTVNLNADFGEVKQQGDIIFTGKYAETHLNEILAADEQGRTATAEEILNSRTTVVEAMTNLYGGRLRVEDGAIYKGYGITAHEDSAATVRVQNATLNHSGYDLTFNSGTTLELTGNNTISGDVRMLENSTLLLNVGDTVGCTDIIGNLDIAGGMTLSDSGSSSIENGILMYVSGGLNVGTENSLTGSAGDCSMTWVGNLLVLNYNEATFNLYFNGTASYNTRQEDKALWHHYQALTFEKCGNDAAGGAIDGSVTMTDNGSVTFSGNTASSSGGAIYTYGSLHIRNNDSVLFEKNAEVRDGTYRLRSIYAYGGSGAEISLSAAAGKSITFRDSIYIGEGSSFKLNEAYEGQAQLGDIIFTGATTVDDLYTVKGNVAGTEEEIRLSRTTEVNTLTNLYGGRLRVEEGAIYQGRGITAMEGSGATVRVQNATLSHEGYDLTFNAGTTLELTGANTITGNVQMLEGSALVFDNTHGNGATDIIGSLGLGVDVSLALGNQAYGSNEVLLCVSGAVSGWDAANLTVQGNSYTTDSFTWVDNLLVLNYDESSFNRYFNGSSAVTVKQEKGVFVHHYQNMSFSGITSSSSSEAVRGGAITGASVYIADNGNIEFRDNSAVSTYSAIVTIQGGAIQTSSLTVCNNEAAIFDGNSVVGQWGYGGALSAASILMKNNKSLQFLSNEAKCDSWISGGGAISATKSLVLECNEFVNFEKNKAISLNEWAYGGAIAGDWGCYTILIQGNGSVSFVDNTASGVGVAHGGAIYSRDDTTLKITGNGTVLFSGNIAGSQGGAIYSYREVGLSENKSLIFEYNAAGYSGGAIAVWGEQDIVLSKNNVLKFNGNHVDNSRDAMGGAIASDKDGSGTVIEIVNNGTVEFCGNTACSTSYAYGGAIYASGKLSIRNNDSVEFYQNAEVSGNTYRLRSIYASGGALSAAAGKSITFRDSIYIGSESTFMLNEAFEGTAQQGDIIFTGAATVDDLYAVKNNVAGTAEEIRLSRTTEVNAMTNLYGGRLRVEEGAIYQGRGITAMEGSAATVRVQNAELSHSGYDLTFNAGTTFELVGNNTITGNVRMLEGSTLHLVRNLGSDFSVLDSSSLLVYGDVTIDLMGNIEESSHGVHSVELLQLQDSSRTWNPTSIRVGNEHFKDYGIVGCCDGLTWSDNTLYLDYYLTDTVVWDNAAGDSLWNNESANWGYEGYRFDYVQGVHVVLGSTGQGEITLVGDIATRNLTVESGCAYELSLADNSSLTVQGTISVGADASLAVHGGLDADAVNAEGSLVVDTQLSVTNAVTASSIQAGSLLADSLNLTNTENSGSISGDATVAGEVVAAGHLNVGGALTAASLQAASLEAGSLTLTGSGAGNVVTDTLNVVGTVQSSADLSVGGAMSAQQVCVAGALSVASLQTEALEAASLTLTDGAASNRIGSSVAMTGAVEAAGSLTLEGTLTAASLQTASLEAAGLTLTDSSTASQVTGVVQVSGQVQTAADLTVGGAMSAQQVRVDGALTAASLQTDSLEADGLTLTDSSTASQVTGAVQVSRLVQTAADLVVGGAMSAQQVRVDGALTAASLLTDALEAGSLKLTDAGACNTVDGTVAVSGSVDVAGSLNTGELHLTGEDAAHTIGGAVTVDGAVDIAGSLAAGGALSGSVVSVGGSLSAASLAAESLNSASLKLTDAGACNTVDGTVAVSGSVDVAGSLNTGELHLTGEDAAHTIGGAVTVGGAVDIAGSLAAGGALSGSVVSVGGALSAASLQAGSLSADSLTLTDAGAQNSIGSSVSFEGNATVAGSLAVQGSFTAAAVSVDSDFTSASLEADSLVSGGAVALTSTETANTVSGDMTVDSVSLAAGATLEVGGVLTADTVQMSGTATVLEAGSFGASEMDFVLDRAALENLGIAYGESATIARSGAALAAGYEALLNGSATESTDAAAYTYSIAVSGNEVKVEADYRWWDTRVWYRGAWVGEAEWEDLLIAGYDAVNGVETVDLGGESYSGYTLMVELEEGASAVSIANGSLKFDYIDMFAGDVNIGQNTTVQVAEMYGEGLKLGISGDQTTVTVSDYMQMGTVALDYARLTVADAEIGAITGTTGSLEITGDAQVTVDSDVTLSSLVNGGSLDMAGHALTVNGLTDEGGNVTAGEVIARSNMRTAATFGTLVADKVTVTNSNSNARYTDDLSVGDGSAIGELVAETLVVRDGSVTLGRTDAAAEMELLKLNLKQNATLVLNQQTELAVTDTLTATSKAVVQLKKDASICYGDTSISNRNESGTVDVNAYALSGKADLVLERAHVSTRSSSAKVVDYQLINSSVENAGTGTLQLTHTGNSLTSIAATSGSVEVYNQAELNLEHLSIGRNQSLAVMSSDVAAGVDEEFEARVNIFGSATFGADSTLIADLSIQSGATIRIEGVVHMGSSITLSSGMVLAGAALENALSLNVAGDYVVLFDGVDSLILDGETPLVYSPGGLTVDDKVLASKYFMGLEEMENLYITFEENSDSESGNSSGGEVRLTLGSEVIPEPTTSTLSLLALAALAARRRRK